MGLHPLHGGGIALGHPIGDSGCRVVVSLIHEMEKRWASGPVRRNEHGQAMILEKVE